MSRSIPAGRFGELVRAATEVFVARGYRLAQMAEVAAAVGVAKGTLYLYVESKEALFLLCALHCDARGAIDPPPRLPVPTPERGETLRVLRRRIGEEGALPLLGAALARQRPRDVRAELEGILRELYAVMQRNRRAIQLVDRCGQDHPELSAALQRETREGAQRRLAHYLESRRHQLRPFSDSFLFARIVIETLTTWAVHLAWDPVPQRFDEKLAEDTVVAFVQGGLLRDPQDRARGRRGG